MKGSRVHKPHARRWLREAEDAGLIRWTGEWRDGEKPYEPTELGRQWDADVIDGDGS